MTEPVKEGWYVDPADRHEYRWFSAGVPTDLVKDAGRTSSDALSMADPAIYRSMQLEQPPDVGPLLHKDDAPPPKFELLNFGSGPAAVVNTAASPPDPAVWVKSAGIAEIVVVLLPMLAALLVIRVPGVPLFAALLLFVLSPVLAVLGRWRRRRMARRFQHPRPGGRGKRRT